MVSFSDTEKRPQATRVSVAEIEKTYCRLFAVADEPTTHKNNPDRMGFLRDDDGTI